MSPGRSQPAKNNIARRCSDVPRREISHFFRIILSSYSSLLLLLRRLAARRLASNRLLPVLLAAAQQLQVSSPASQRLLRNSLKASGVFLVDGLSPNERRLLRLDNLVAGLNALRSTEKNKVSVGVCCVLCALRALRGCSGQKHQAHPDDNPWTRSTDGKSPQW